MAHLVEVQHERGATGGHIFHSLLSSSLPPDRGWTPVLLCFKMQWLSLSPLPFIYLLFFLLFLAAHTELVVNLTPPSCCYFLIDSAETSKAKVTVEMSHSSVKMRAATQLPAVGPDEDLTGMLLQVWLSSEILVTCVDVCSFAATCNGTPPHQS